MAELAIPRTNAPEVPISKASLELLEKFVSWWEGANEQTVARWRAVGEAARVELEKRQTAITAAAPDASTALARVREPTAITERLKALADKFHLVTPATEIDHVPDGFGVSVSMVRVDPSDDKKGPGEVYGVGGGKVGLAKQPLERIGSAAGIAWDMTHTGRLDSAAEPRYVHFRAVGCVRNFDGSPRMLSGECELDYRDGSDQINEIRTKAKARNRDPEPQILEKRKFILREAESKAKLRAIASMGIKRAYWPRELGRPFAVARLTFTGQTDDPELRREFSRMAAAAALGGAASLFGSPPAALGAPAGHAPPALDDPTDEPSETEDAEFEEAAPMREPGDDSEELPT